MLTVKLRFTTCGIHQRDGMVINRSIDELLKFNYNNIPVTLMHPENIDSGEKDLLSTNTHYSIIGSISGQPIVEKFIDEDGVERNNLYVIAKIADPHTIQFLKNQKHSSIHMKYELDTSPAVVSRFEPSSSENYEFEEIIESINHLSLLIDEDDKLGFWSLYDDSKTPSVELVDTNDENKIQHTIIVHPNNKIDELDNSKNIGEKNIMAILENESTAKVDNEEIIDSTEEVKEEEVKEEPKVDNVEEPKVDEEDKIDSTEEVVEEAIKEIIAEAIPVEEPKVDEDEVIIDSDEFTEDDKEAEIITEIISNLVDSVDGFRKPMFKHHRVSPVSIAKKALKMNIKLVDSKYHTLVEHLDKKSLPLAKEILVDMKSKSPKVGNKNSCEYVQVSQNTFMKKFI